MNQILWIHLVFTICENSSPHTSFLNWHHNQSKLENLHQEAPLAATKSQLDLLKAESIHQEKNGATAGSRIPQQQGVTVWFTGLSGAGKTTICQAVATELLARELQVEVIDGDVIRKNLCRDLGFSKEDREENIRRIAFVSQMLTRNGIVVLVSAISPYRSAREAARKSIGHFIEVYVSTPLSVCELRDAKGLYKMARAGRLSGFTGIDDPYEAPLAPDIECSTEFESTPAISSAVVANVLEYLSSRRQSQNV